jgi:hypothetical protein
VSDSSLLSEILLFFLPIRKYCRVIPLTLLIIILGIGGTDLALAQADERVPAWKERIDLGGLFYFSYQDGEGGDEEFSRWRVKRGHVDLRADLLPHLRARVTTDVKHDPDADLTLRIKYAYGEFHMARLGPIRHAWLEVGQVRLPWIFFEESIYRYRLQDGTFMDRLGLTSSADRGLTIGGLLGPELPESFREHVNPRQAGRWGSFAMGVYDGGGFTVDEENTNKVFQGRLTVRPLPTHLPGFQVSSLTVRGRGNTEATPTWALDTIMLSLETPRLVMTAKGMQRDGDPAGRAVDDRGDSLHGEGWSLFAELKLGCEWSLIARQDAFDPDTRFPRDSWHRTIAGVARHLGSNNMLLLDWERREPTDESETKVERLQFTLQLTI